MDYKTFCYGSSALFGLAGCIVYFVPIFQRKTRPKTLTWVIWAICDTILMMGMIARDALNGQMLVIVPCAWLLVVISLRYGINEWTKTDSVCSVSVALAIISWLFTKNPETAIAWSIITITIGTGPTVQSVWTDPTRERWWPWAFGLIAPILTIFSLRQYVFASLAQPIAFLVLQAIIVALVARPRAPIGIKEKRL